MVSLTQSLPIRLGVGVLTLGVQGAVLDPQGRVLLVKHSYVPGENVMQALTRELQEEANVELTEMPLLHGIFFNSRVSRRDHVVLFVVRGFAHESWPQPNSEIIDHGFFATGDLPPGTSRAVRSRLDEILHGTPLATQW